MSTSSSNAGSDDRPARVLEAHDVSLSFGQTPALRGASMSVATGEILAVMGPSGSGKSTLLHCLAGILAPDTGEIHFAGRRIDTLRENARAALRRDRFGFVFQFGQLVPELSVEENIALPLLLRGARRADALNRARGWLERLDLTGLERRRSGELSGGQAQRVALARGLVADPDVLLCASSSSECAKIFWRRILRDQPVSAETTARAVSASRESAAVAVSSGLSDSTAITKGPPAPGQVIATSLRVANRPAPVLSAVVQLEGRPARSRAVPVVFAISQVFSCARSGAGRASPRRRARYPVAMANGVVVSRRSPRVALFRSGSHRSSRVD
ncbi:ATP-binding cassette domain-containing protein [Frankia sp. Ag45/Mut15]|uniref:ATP-binding cassette domain-containing protein n=1 Tax=Frankia umida TaxID=573489 RepID=A0ABT0JW72_9ACTN|nr:ATP-binding cassette domain-containing protein [Frankia umida]